MKHKHHIIPKHMGGTDDPSNIEELTIEDHSMAHKLLYEKFGKKEDYIAWKALDGSIGIEEIISERCSIGGKKGVETLRKLKNCSFFNEDLRSVAAEKGRIICKENGVGFYDSELQSVLGKKGGKKNKGFVWLNDGNINLKYSPKMQNKKSVEQFLKENPNFKLGRLQTNEIIECPHCNKKGVKSGMVLHHFDKCFVITKKSRTFTIKTVECPHCGKIGAGGSMKRNHFDNCKYKKEKQ